MKRTLCIFFILTCSIFTVAQNKQTFGADKDSLSEQEIQKLEFFLANLIENGDIETYAGYLTDDYVRIAANGIVSTKQQVIDGMKNVNSKVKMTPRDLKVRIYGNTAILQGILDLETKSVDVISKRTSIITKIFIKRDGKWYMASLQGTSLL
jgi:ketosteroid isomerase-like protein